jgi:hypothetical protein
MAGADLLDGCAIGEDAVVVRRFWYVLMASPAMQNEPCSVSTIAAWEPGVCPGAGTTRSPGARTVSPSTVSRFGTR